MSSRPSGPVTATEEDLLVIATDLLGHSIEETSSGKTLIKGTGHLDVDDDEEDNLSWFSIMDFSTFERRLSVETIIRALMEEGIPFTIAHNGDEEGVCLVQVGDPLTNPDHHGDPWEELVEAAADAVRNRGEDGDG